jgi:drug/metabolite transporter (DMT)-like permease
MNHNLPKGGPATLRSYLWKYIVALLIFGSNGVIVSHIAMSSSEIVLCRTVIGGICISIVSLLHHERLAVKGHHQQLFFLFIASIALGANWLFLFEAYQHIGVSLATLACYCGPVIVMILSPFLLQEHLTVPKLLGIIAVCIGMICVNGIDVANSGLSWGLFCGIMAAASYAILIMAAKKTAGISGMVCSAFQLIIASVMVAIFLAVTGPAAITLTGETVFYIILLGLFNTGFACYLYFMGLQNLPAQTASIYSYIEPLSALFFAAVFLGEALSLLQLTGAVLILGGVMAAEIIGSHPKLQWQHIYNK